MSPAPADGPDWCPTCGGLTNTGARKLSARPIDPDDLIPEPAASADGPSSWKQRYEEEAAAHRLAHAQWLEVRAERDALRGAAPGSPAVREAAARAVAAWDAGWDCSRTPGHADVSEAIDALRAVLEGVGP